MIEIKIDVRDFIGPELKRFGADADKITMSAMRGLGNKYRNFLRRSYLSGQMLKRQSGKTYSGVKVTGKTRDLKVIISTRPKVANIFEHPGGVTIRPKHKKALWFIGADGAWIFTKKAVHLSARPFMTESFKTFDISREFPPLVDIEMRKELAKRGLA